MLVCVFAALGAALPLCEGPVWHETMVVHCFTPERVNVCGESLRAIMQFSYFHVFQLSMKLA